jgi:hypothetical protein
LASQEEPVCTSRFDYDHKMLQKMIMFGNWTEKC